MILNRSGIEKLVSYIGEDHCKYVNLNGRHLILGMFTESDINNLKDIGVSLNHIGSMLHEADLDSVEVDQTASRTPTQPDQPEQPTDEEIKQLAKALMPYLAMAFPTKAEMNDVLQDLTAQSIDPEEMINGLKNQIRSIKKQSRTNDEVG